MSKLNFFTDLSVKNQLDAKQSNCIKGGGNEGPKLRPIIGPPGQG